MKQNKQLLLALFMLCSLYSFAQNTFPSTGNVGIGDTVPGSTLKIFKFDGPTMDMRYQNGAGYSNFAMGHANSFGGELALYSFGGNYNGTGAYRGYGSYIAGGYQGGLSIGAASSTGNLYFYAGGENDAHERMRITNTGNIGIGTTNPTSLLDVAGSINISGNNAPSILQIDAHNSTSNIAKILFKNSGGGGDFKIAGDGGDVQWQGGGSRQLQMGAYHGIVLVGARATTADMSFEGGTGTAFNTKIRNTNPASVGLIVQGHGSQYGDLQQWVNEAGTPLSVINSSGNVGIGTNTPIAKAHITSPGGINSGLLIEATSSTDYATTDWKNDAGDLTQMLMSGSGFNNGIYNARSASFGTGAPGGVNVVATNGSGIIRFATGGYSVENERMQIAANGNVGIGTTTPQSKLAVNGTITTTKLKVTQTGWADYVFESNYKLPTLKEVEEFIKRHKHLPGIVSAKDVEKDGLDVGENQAALLKKIEELTLYMIDMKKQLETQQKQILLLEERSQNQ